MKNRWLKYSALALLAELGTTWVQSRFPVVTDLEPGVIYYPRFGDFMITRVVIWLFLYLALTATLKVTAVVLRKRGAGQ